jgi:hypothetical protein
LITFFYWRLNMPAIAGSFWKGSDGNVYVYGDQGTNKAGAWDANTADYWINQGYSPIADPNPQPQVLGDTTSGGGGYGTGGGGPTVDPNAMALYDQGIGQTQSALERLLSQENVGRGNIQGDWQTARNTLNTQKARTQDTYNQSKVDTTKENIRSKSDIDFATGRQANQLQRLLGARGAGSSSAARVAAPYAAALQGTQQRDQVNEAFAGNMAGLDKSWNLYNEDWNGSVADVDTQKRRNEDALTSDILGKRSSLLQTLANLQSQKASAAGGNGAASAQPYLDQVNGIENQIAGLGSKYQGAVAAKNPTYAAPDLAKYEYDKAAGPKFNNESALTDTISPYLTLLLNARKDKQQLV